MTLDVVIGLGNLHSKGVQHCDLSCRESLSLQGAPCETQRFWALASGSYSFEPTFREEPQYELPLRERDFNDRPPLNLELFALGSAIFEIVAWKRPFQEFPDHLLEVKYARNEFPSLEDNPAASVIRRCWPEEFNDAEVLEALQSYVLDFGGNAP